MLEGPKIWEFSKESCILRDKSREGRSEKFNDIGIQILQGGPEKIDLPRAVLFGGKSCETCKGYNFSIKHQIEMPFFVKIFYGIWTTFLKETAPQLDTSLKSYSLHKFHNFSRQTEPHREGQFFLGHPVLIIYNSRDCVGMTKSNLPANFEP